jgi:sorbitol-specific phosphotransferase system component IIC
MFLLKFQQSSRYMIFCNPLLLLLLLGNFLIEGGNNICYYDESNMVYNKVQHVFAFVNNHQFWVFISFKIRESSTIVFEGKV